jgi:hypothetical protein
MNPDGFFIVDPFSASAVEKDKQVDFSSCKKYGSLFCRERVGRFLVTGSSKICDFLSESNTATV